MDEFGFIATLLAPLAAKEKGALGLKDDAAVLSVPSGQELVITQDAITQGVHFIGDEEPGLIARKLLRVNLSDLAAMGARPWGYFLSLMLPASADEAWLKAFAAGLRRDQKEFGMTLMGGDTTRIKGTLALSVSALGLVPKGRALKRSGARAGDGIFVSGTIGDAALGLQVARGEGRGARKDRKSSRSLTLDLRSSLLQRYRLPEPRLALGQALRDIATSCMDVSDGLMQDLGHMCAASRVGAEIRWEDIPLSQAVRAAVKPLKKPHECVLAGGDDYELLFTAPLSLQRTLRTIAGKIETRISLIGQMTKERAIKVLDEKGGKIVLGKSGWRHF